MENSGAAQSKLGELFVDIGVGGAGKALKTLNSISASFLLTKNAAVQMAKPIVNTVKQTMGMAVDVGKIGSTLGIAYKDAYKLQYYFKHMNLNPGLVGDIEKISEQFNLVGRGLAGISKEQAVAFQTLGMDWHDYIGGGYEKTLKFFKDLQEKSSKVNRTTASTALQGMGVSNEWLYAFDRGGFDLSDALSISNEKIDSAIQASEDLNAAQLQLENALQELTITITPYVSEYAPKLASAIGKYGPKVANAMEKYLPSIMESLKNLAKSLGWLARKKKKAEDWWNDEITGMHDIHIPGLSSNPSFNSRDDSYYLRLLKAETPEEIEKIREEYLNRYKKKPTPPKTTPSSATPSNMVFPSPNIFNPISGPINITNNITGANASEIARKTSISTKDVIEGMLNKYQVSNIPGK